MLRLILFISLSCIYLSCQSQAPVASTQQGSAAEAEIIMVDELPLWMVEAPQSDEWYIGIGGASSGNQGLDRVTATERARQELAASISVHYLAELSVEEIDSAQDGYSENVRSQIEQSINQSLIDVITEAMFYSEKEGYWVYLKMNKAKWTEAMANDKRIALTLNGSKADEQDLLSIFYSEESPYQWTPNERFTPFRIIAEWQDEALPVIDDLMGLVFVNTSISIRLEHYGVVLWTESFGPLKEGGLDENQAIQRAHRSIFHLMETQDLANTISSKSH